MVFIRVLKLSFLVILLQLMFTEPVQAYLDPGSGSLIIQAIVAGVLGALYLLKRFWRNIKRFLSQFIKGRPPIER